MHPPFLCIELLYKSFSRGGWPVPLVGSRLAIRSATLRGRIATLSLRTTGKSEWRNWTMTG